MLKAIIGKITRAYSNVDEIPITEVLVRELLPKDVLEDLESVNRTDEIIDRMAGGETFDGQLPWDANSNPVPASQLAMLLQNAQFTRQQLGGMQNAGLGLQQGRIIGAWGSL